MAAMSSTAPRHPTDIIMALNPAGVAWPAAGKVMGPTFDDAIALRRLGDGHFEASTPPSWTASGRAPGGLLEAQLLAAIDSIVEDDGLRPLSFTAHLLRAPAEGDYEIHVEVLRAGRTVWSLAARILQGGKLIATALSSYAAERTGPDFDERPMPNVEPPSRAQGAQGYRPEFAFPFAENLVVQERLGPEVFSAPDGPMDRIGWIGLTTPRPIDAPALLLLTDTGLMAWWVRLERMHLTATLDHTTHFRADLSTVDSDGFVLLHSRTGLVRDGYLDWDIDVWAPGGTLLCQSRQMLVVLG